MTLQDIQRKGDELSSLHQQLTEQEHKVSVIKDRIRQIETEHLPAMMQSVGITGLDVEGGSRIELKDVVFGKIDEENKKAAFDWLIKNKHDGIIKNELKMNFSRGDNKEALRIAEMIRSQGIPVTQEQKVNPQTLNAFIREMVEADPQFPKDTFKVVELQKVVFK